MKWVKRILLGLLALVVVSVLVVYAWSAVILNARYEAEPRSLLLSSRPDVIAHGERLAQVFGCYHGCHAPDMEGQVFFDQWYIARVVAPNLTRAARDMSTSEFEALVRQGVRPDGRSVFGMPSASFASMTDRDLSAILSFIAQYPEQANDAGATRFGPLARLFLVLGEFQPAAKEVAHEPWESGLESTPLKHGEYLALNACSECHGLELEGSEGFAPPLAIAKGYDLDAFRRLMAEGVGLGERDLGLMSRVAKARFSHMTPAEVEALHAYLHSR